MIELAQVDWQGIALVITAVGAVVAAVLEHLGKKREAKQVKAVVHGVEKAANGEALEALKSALKTANVDLDSDTAQGILNVVHKATKDTIKKTALEHGVEHHLNALVEKEGLGRTSRLSRERLKEKLDET